MAETNISILPSEALLNIFSHVSYPDLMSCCLVCHHWSHLASHPSLWRLFPLIKKEYNINKIRKLVLIPRLSKANSLELLGCFDFYNFIISSEAKRKCTKTKDSTFDTLNSLSLENVVFSNCNLMSVSPAKMSQLTRYTPFTSYTRILQNAKCT